MDSNEFWCRAFLAAMRDHAGDLERCQEIADAALWRAQRRGMVAGERTAPVESPAPEAVETWPVDFTADRDGDMWTLRGWELGGAGIQVLAGRESYPMGAAVVHIKWGEMCPPKPIKVWLERAKGGS
jgi:hypothetical protein